MQEKSKIKKSTKYLLIGTLVLFISILGVSMAYYLARIQGSLSGRAAGTDLDIEITKLSTNASNDLIPLDNDIETLGQAALGYENNGSCVDINGYSVCQIYRVRVINNGSVPLAINGIITLSGQNVPNIDCARMDDEDTITNNSSCKNGMFVNGDTLAANSHNDYYVMVYIKNLDEPQTDSGEFNGTVVFTSTDGKQVKGRFNRTYNLVEYITNLYTDAEKTVVVNNEIDYYYANSVNLMNDRLGGTTESLDGGNIRYYGASPNNYIDIGDRTLNDEVILWRIIGVFEGKLRLRRSDTIKGGYSYDASPYYVNNGYGINEWSQADLMKLLNPGYENNEDQSCIWNTSTEQFDCENKLINNSLWWNKESGICYKGQNSKTTTCDFTNTGLSDRAKEYLLDQVIYLGGFDRYNIYANQAYTMERDNNVFNNTKSCYLQSNCNDTITRTTSWTGKVGLIYPSDFGYAADFSNANCQSTLDVHSSCVNNWMTDGVIGLVSPASELAYKVSFVNSSSFGSMALVAPYVYWPTVLLDHSVVIEPNGDGSITNPYVLTS